MTDSYRAPGWFTRNVFNQLVSFLTRQGVSVLGSRVLAVKGRTSGQWRTTPVNLLTYDGRRYLVAPRGQTQWVRNLRAAGTGELRVGRRTETFRGRELTDEEKAPGQTPATTRSGPSHPNTRRSKYSVSSSSQPAPATASSCATTRPGPATSASQ